MNDLIEKVTVLVIDPKFKVGTLALDDARHIFLRIEHPIHGDLDIFLTVTSAAVMRDGLQQAIIDRAAP